MTKFNPFDCTPYPDVWAAGDFLLSLDQKPNGYLKRKKHFETQEEFKLRCQTSLFPIGYSEELNGLVGKIFDNQNNFEPAEEYLKEVSEFLSHINLPVAMTHFCHYGSLGILLTFNEKTRSYLPNIVTPPAVLSGYDKNGWLEQLVLSVQKHELVDKVALLSETSHLYAVKSNVVQFTEFTKKNSSESPQNSYTETPPIDLVNLFGDKLSFIPFTYGTCTAFVDFMRSMSVFQQYIQYDIERYRAMSVIRKLTYDTLAPVLTRTGLSSEAQDIILDPSGIVNLYPGEELKWLEHSGSGVQMGVNDLERLEATMAKIGYTSLLEPTRLVQKSATEINAVQVTQISGIGKIVNDFNILLNKAIWMYLKLNIDPSTPFTDFFQIRLNLLAEIKTPPSEVVAEHLLKAVLAGVLTKETYLKEMKRIGLLSSFVDIDEEVASLDPSF